MTETKSRTGRIVEGTALAACLVIPCAIVLRSALGPLESIAAGVVVAIFAAWMNV